MPKNYCIMQIWAESGKSALPICNYSQILYQFLTFTQNLKRSLLQRFYFSETVSKTGFYHARHFQSRRLSVNGMISLPALPCLKNTLFMESYSRLHDTDHTILPW